MNLASNQTALHTLSSDQLFALYPELTAIDYYLARSLFEDIFDEEDNNEQHLYKSQVLASFLLLSQVLRDGHSCLLLEAFAGKIIWNDEDNDEQVGFELPTLEVWSGAVNALPHHAQSGWVRTGQGGGTRLYLRRYYGFETELKQQIAQRNRALDLSEFEPMMANVLDDLFPSNAPIESASSQEKDWQKIAVANSLNHNFSVICGGPGTGKTTTVLKLLLSICELWQMQKGDDSAQRPPIQMAMVAPTGKAAQRLSESIVGAKQSISALKEGIYEAVLENIPETAQTIHRLLGVIPHQFEFRFNQDNPLNIDVLLLDEASMVDLALMVRVFRALPDKCRVILLGDAQQLPSVAAGSVLADIAPLPHLGYSSAQCEWLSAVTKGAFESSNKAGSHDYLTNLIISYRFKDDSGIGHLAKQVMAGEGEISWQTLKQFDDLSLAPASISLNDYLKPLVNRYIKPVFSAATPVQAFEYLHGFKLLSPLRAGETGVDQLNQSIEHLLLDAGCIQQTQSIKGRKTAKTFYQGKPIMILQNDYHEQLFNGDIGIIWQDDNRDLVAYFESVEGLRKVRLSRLPKFECVYAMTIHKTQGSEFDHVAIILPNEPNRILSRELLYTGLTRAKSSLSVYTHKAVWSHCVTQKVARFSGLSGK